MSWFPLIITSFADLFTKLGRRPKLKELKRIILDLEIEGFIAQDGHPLDIPKKKRRALIQMILMYREHGILTNVTCYLSLVSIHIRQVLQFSYALALGKIYVCRLSKKTVREMQVQFTRGEYNLNSSFFTSIPSIDCYYQRSDLSFRDRWLLCCGSLKYRSIDVWHLFQFLKFEEDVSSISWEIEELVVEEGGDYTVNCLSFLLRDKVRCRTLTKRCPNLYMEYPNFGYDRIITNTTLVARKLEVKNENVHLMMKFPDLNLSVRAQKDPKNTLGYVAEIGKYLMCYEQKQQLDLFSIDFCKKNKLNIFVTVHPQERKLNRSYYESTFSGENVLFRETGAIGEYLSSVDVVIGWWSTVLFQAVLMRKPVIITDFFGDDVGDEFQSCCKEVVFRAKSPSEVQDIYNCIQLMSADEMDLAFDNVFDRLLGANWRI